MNAQQQWQSQAVKTYLQQETNLGFEVLSFRYFEVPCPTYSPSALCLLFFSLQRTEQHMILGDNYNSIGLLSQGQPCIDVPDTCTSLLSLCPYIDTCAHTLMRSGPTVIGNEQKLTYSTSSHTYTPPAVPPLLSLHAADESKTFKSSAFWLFPFFPRSY